MNTPNPMKLLQIKKSIDTINENHPKLQGFLKDMSDNAIMEGTVMELNVTTPDGRKVMTNIKLKQSDIDAINAIR